MTPLHSSVISDRPDLLELLLKQLTTDESVRRSLLLANEKEGRSLIHLAASLCTEVMFLPTAEIFCPEK